MKTIIIPIFHGHVSRNFFLTDIYRTLVKREDLRLVVLTHNFKKKYFLKRFGGDNVIVEGLDVGALKTQRLERFFKSIFHFFVYSPRVMVVFKEKYSNDGSLFHYVSRVFLTLVMGHSRLLRNLTRYAYSRTIKPKKVIEELFDQYNPDGVILPDATFDVDNYILKVAKERNIPSVSMLRSFDALPSNKGALRIRPESLVVQSEYMRKDAIKLGDMNPQKIYVVGMPHFDFYAKGHPSDKGKFYAEKGLDPQKKFILVSFTGGKSSPINNDIINIILDAIEDGRLPRDTQVLARLHPNSETEQGPNRSNLVYYKSEGIYFDRGRLADMEFTPEWRQELFDSLFFSSLTINPQSAMTLDAAALDKPVINIFFDGYKKLPYAKSVVRLYDMSHYFPLMDSGGLRLAKSESDLINLINLYLENPRLDSEERMNMMDEQGFKSDGNAAHQIANTLLGVLKM
jgi:hypothetical protein